MQGATEMARERIKISSSIDAGALDYIDTRVKKTLEKAHEKLLGMWNGHNAIASKIPFTFEMKEELRLHDEKMRAHSKSTSVLEDEMKKSNLPVPNFFSQNIHYTPREPRSFVRYE